MKGPYDWLVVGLGNPGRKYSCTWHNLGFMTMERVATRHHFTCEPIRFKGLTGETRLFGGRQLFLLPQTFMNASGESVREAAEFYKIPPKRILVVYDDLNIPLGTVRVRKKGSAGGQNGMRDIIYQLGSEDFPRVRVGYGPKPPEMDMISFVLQKIPEGDRTLVNESLDLAADAVELVLQNDLDRAMRETNRRGHGEEA